MVNGILYSFPIEVGNSFPTQHASFCTMPEFNLAHSDFSPLDPALQMVGS